MNFFRFIKQLFLFLLIFLLGADNIIAKPTPLPSKKHTVANIAYNDALSMGKLGVDAGLLAMGVRNLQGASALLKAELTTQNVVRLLLGFGDIATLGLGELCKNDNSEFCKAYRQYEFYVNMGLLSSNILNEFPQIYKGLKKGLDNPNLSNKQKEGLRKVLNAEELANAVDVSSVVKKLKGISTKYADYALEQIAKKADELKLNSRVTDDFVRVGELKDFSSSSLIEQMQNWVKIKKRGFPFSFNTLSEFNVFKSKLNNLLKDVNINVADVRIQGSSLRKVNPNDIDVAVFLKQKDYNKLVTSIRSKYKELNEIAQKTVKNSKSFEKDLLKGKISSFHFDKLSNGNTFKRGLYEELGRKVDVSIIVEGGKFDVSPYLKF